jgi:UDPglucose 6-dehydrogenase
VRIAVIGGAGYVGLTTSICLASRGNHVFCVDKDRKKIEHVANGKPSIYETCLEEMLRDVLLDGRLVATTDLNEAVHGSEVSFICVGTPSKKDGSIDLTFVRDVSGEIGEALSDKSEYNVVVVRSTVVPGTTEQTVLPLLEQRSGKKVGESFGLCVNPEFLQEGNAVEDFLRPTRRGIVVGEFDQRSGDKLLRVYEGFDAEILRTTLKTAEMIKYARNSYLAKDISFANEIANLCQELDLDYLDVKRGMEMDARIGKGRFLNAGVGFGGSCFPKDVKALKAMALSKRVRLRLLEATLDVNANQPYKAIEILEEHIGKLENRKVAVLGLAFKRDTDDMREAPSLKIVGSLLSKKVAVVAYDPKATETARKIFGKAVMFKDTAKEALMEADACIIVTDWNEFADADIFDVMKGRIIVDGRRILDPSRLKHGLKYYAIGKPEHDLSEN